MSLGPLNLQDSVLIYFLTPFKFDEIWSALRKEESGVNVYIYMYMNIIILMFYHDSEMYSVYNVYTQPFLVNPFHERYKIITSNYPDYNLESAMA